MKTNVKPGDLAIVVKPKCLENLGKIVRVVEDWGNRTHLNGIRFDIKSTREVTWLVECTGSPLVTRGVITGMIMRHSSGPAADSSLRPLRDDEQPESIETNLEVTA